jgi:16S rRNA (uracil1498-N3)-methyltransferase
MRTSRLYVPLPLSNHQLIELDDDSAHYIRTVLRLKKGQSILLFDGSGSEYLCSVAEASRKTVSVQVNESVARSVESPLSVTLGLGISRGDRMDWSVQKSVELGANSITPLLTERCVVQFKDEKKSQRLQHWQKIAQHACEQSGRTVLPAFGDIEQLESWVSQQQGLKVFLDPYADTTLNALTPVGQHVTLLAGPEGGFTDGERELAKATGFIPVRLGQRILRTETAALSALAAVQMLWGDFAL